MTFSLRPETPADFAAIKDVVKAAFGSDVEADLVDKIRADPSYAPQFSLVACADDGAVVGHVMLEWVRLRPEYPRDAFTDQADPAEWPRVLCLSPLAVAPDFQRRGVGSTLVRKACADAAAAGQPLIVLQGDPAFYGRLGFVASEPLGITQELPDWAPREAAQVWFAQSDQRGPRGHVVLPPPFDGLE